MLRRETKPTSMRDARRCLRSEAMAPVKRKHYVELRVDPALLEAPFALDAFVVASQFSAFFFFFLI